MAKKVNNPRWPHTVVISRIKEFNPLEDIEKPEPIVIYEGKCRSYQKEYVSMAGEVQTSKRILSIPLKNNEWEVIPLENDRVEVNLGSYKEEGRVVDKMPNNFGTEIYWEYDRN